MNEYSQMYSLISLKLLYNASLIEIYSLNAREENRLSILVFEIISAPMKQLFSNFGQI